MDLEKAIRGLLAERNRISGIITQLELLEHSPADTPVRQPKPRGRKSMSSAEREVVSTRMRQYWESRRKEKEK